MEIEEFISHINGCSINESVSQNFLRQEEGCWDRRPSFREGNYFLLKTENEKVILIVKISRSVIPFWGVGERVLDFFNQMEKTKFFLVLLDSRKTGWVFPKAEIDFHRKNTWSFSGNELKVNSGKLGSENRFFSENNFLTKIESFLSL